jgi:hypothetical protein
MEQIEENLNWENSYRFISFVKEILDYGIEK